MPGIPVIEPCPRPAEGGLPPGAATWTPDRAVPLVHDVRHHSPRPV